VKRRTVASPIPDVPPVTSATLPSSLAILTPALRVGRLSAPRFVRL
jgi:hypothetical protein